MNVKNNVKKDIFIPIMKQYKIMQNNYFSCGSETVNGFEIGETKAICRVSAIWAVFILRPVNKQKYKL